MATRNTMNDILGIKTKSKKNKATPAPAREPYPDFDTDRTTVPQEADEHDPDISVDNHLPAPIPLVKKKPAATGVAQPQQTPQPAQQPVKPQATAQPVQPEPQQAQTPVQSTEAKPQQSQPVQQPVADDMKGMAEQRGTAGDEYGNSSANVQSEEPAKQPAQPATEEEAEQQEYQQWQKEQQNGQPNNSNAAPASSTPATPAQPAAPASQTKEDEANKQGKGSEKTWLSYKRMAELSNPELDEEKIKQARKRQKWASIFSAIGDGVSSLANLYYTTKGAPNQNLQPNLSDKARERKEKFDKEIKDYNANRRTAIEKAMNLDKEWDYRDERNKKADAEKAAEMQYRKDRDAANDAYRDKKDKTDADRWEREFNERMRQFNINSKLQRQQLALEARRQKAQEGEPYQTFVTGNGGSVRVDKKHLNSNNIAYVFGKLPEEERNKYVTVITQKDITGREVPTKQVKQPSAEDMLLAIGTYIGNNSDPIKTENVVSGLKEIGAEVTAGKVKKGRGY